MSNRAELLKSIIKGTSDISEDASLDKYLLSRGINPKYATKDQKVAHSKTGQFIKWKNDHMRDLGEAVDKKDTVTMDIPLLIRVLELTREDIKTDMDLHRVVEKLINIRNKGMLTMKDYNYIAKIHEEVMSQVSPEVIEKVERIDEISTTGYHAAAIKSRQDAAVKVMSSMGQDKQAKTKLDARNRGLKRLSDRTSAEMKKANSGPQRPAPVHKPPTEAELRGYGKGRYMGDSVEHDNETMVEAQSAAIRFQKALQREKAKREEQERKDAESKARAEKLLNPPKVNESDCSCSDVPPQEKDKKLIQMSKSARIIKSIYKKKGVAEEMYDHEKEDKSVATYGKKPKISTTDPKQSMGERKPDAAAVLTGGTTLTGQPRDTVEIDPMMRKRPGPDIPGKKQVR
jgi:hypothetical protein